MTQSTLPPASGPPPLPNPCQITLCVPLGVKAIWFFMALAFVGLQWQVLGFAAALAILAAATWNFGTGNRTLAIGLAWAGVCEGMQRVTVDGNDTGDVSFVGQGRRDDPDQRR